MKLINTKEIIKKIIGEIDILEEAEEEYQHGPCFQIKIDRDNNNIIFFINNEEKMKCSLVNIDESFINIDNISYLLTLFKKNNFKLIKDELNKYKKN